MNPSMNLVKACRVSGLSAADIRSMVSVLRARSRAAAQPPTACGVIAVSRDSLLTTLCGLLTRGSPMSR